MEDKKIVDLYWLRSESAISETKTKYGKYCHTIAHNILCNIALVGKHPNPFESQVPCEPRPLWVLMF